MKRTMARQLAFNRWFQVNLGFSAQPRLPSHLQTQHLLTSVSVSSKISAYRMFHNRGSSIDLWGLSLLWSRSVTEAAFHYIDEVMRDLFHLKLFDDFTPVHCIEHILYIQCSHRNYTTLVHLALSTNAFTLSTVTCEDNIAFQEAICSFLFAHYVEQAYRPVDWVNFIPFPN